MRRCLPSQVIRKLTTKMTQCNSGEVFKWMERERNWLINTLSSYFKVTTWKCFENIYLICKVYFSSADRSVWSLNLSALIKLHQVKWFNYNNLKPQTLTNSKQGWRRDKEIDRQRNSGVAQMLHRSVTCNGLCSCLWSFSIFLISLHEMYTKIYKAWLETRS